MTSLDSPEILAPKGNRRTSLLQRIGMKATAFALIPALSAAGGALAGAAWEKHANPSVSKEAVENIAQRATDTALGAERTADYYTKEVNKATRGSQEMPLIKFLNGTIYVDSNTKNPHAYRNPIILTLNTGTDTVTYDSKGKFLEHGYIGVASTEPTGEVRITAVPYDAQHSKFVPYDQSKSVIDGYAYAEGGKDGSAIYVYDPNIQQTLRNPDDTIVSPVLVG